MVYIFTEFLQNWKQLLSAELLYNIKEIKVIEDIIRVCRKFTNFFNRKFFVSNSSAGWIPTSKLSSPYPVSCPSQL